MRKAIRELLRNCVLGTNGRRIRHARPVARQLKQYRNTEDLENRTLLAAQLVASDVTERTINAGDTIEVPVLYQTLDDNNQPAALQTNLVSFNLHFDATQLNYVSTAFNTGEGIQVVPNMTRPESDVTVIGDDNDAATDTVLVASYSDSDFALNLGWPNQPSTDGLLLYTVTFTARSTFSGTNINFSANQQGNVIGANAQFDFQSQSLTLNENVPDPPTVSIAPAAAVVEGENSLFVVSLSEASENEVTVEYSTAGGVGTDPAISGDDFEAVTDQTLTFAAGETEKTISIVTIDDPQDEPSETFSVSLANAVGATIGTSSAVGTISDNDNAVTLSIVESLDVGEGSVAGFQLSLAAPAPYPINVTYSTVDGGPSSTPTQVAEGGQDYNRATSQTITISPGESTATIPVQTIDDTILEPSEFFEVVITTDPDIVVVNARSEARILDNDSPPDVMFSVSDATAVTEGGDLTFTVSIDSAPSGDVSVSYLAGGAGPAAASVGTDFDATSGILTFTPNGPLTQTVTVSTIDDTAPETTEGLQLALSNATGGLIDDGIGLASINDNDSPGQNATIQGRKWNDSNGNGVLEAGEGFLNGWSIQLVNSAGTIIDTTVTADRDINNDGQIDPVLETGWYQFSVAPGSYTVQEIQQEGWLQTYPDTPLEALAFELDTDLELRSTVFDFFDWGGRMEKWMLSPEGWYFVTPDGTLWEWDGSGRENLTGTQTAVLSPEYYEDVSLIYDAEPAELTTYTLASGETATADFGNVNLVQQGQISGRKWNDLNGDGQYSSNEPFLNGWVIQLVDELGNVVQTTTTADVDLDNNGQIDPLTETGLYQFFNVAAGSYTVQEVVQNGWRQTSPADPARLQAYELDQQLGLETRDNLFEDWGGLQERWLRGTDNWYFITPNGNFFGWNGSPRSNLSGNLLAELPTEYYNNPSLLSDAGNPFVASVDVLPGQFYTDINFGNTEIDPDPDVPSDFAGVGNVNARVVGRSLVIDGDSGANGVLINRNLDGWVTVSGLGDTTILGQNQWVIEGWSSIPADLRINLGGGNDAIVLQDLTVDRNLSVNASGNDYFIADNLTVGRLTDYRSTSGDNTVAFNDSNLGTLLRVLTRNGNDALYTNSTSVGGSTIVYSRGGSDIFATQDTSFGQDLTWDAGADNDQMVAVGQNSFGRSLTIDGRAGNDAYDLASSSSFSRNPVIRRFESSEIPDANDVLDSVMSRLADVGLDSIL